VMFVLATEIVNYLWNPNTRIDLHRLHRILR
jgi:hypothetical protein